MKKLNVIQNGEKKQMSYEEICKEPEHIGEVMRLLKAAYDDGRQYPSPDEWERRKD